MLIVSAFVLMFHCVKGSIVANILCIFPLTVIFASHSISFINRYTKPSIIDISVIGVVSVMLLTDANASVSSASLVKMRAKIGFSGSGETEKSLPMVIFVFCGILSTTMLPT